MKSISEMAQINVMTGRTGKTVIFWLRSIMLYCTRIPKHTLEANYECPIGAD